MTKPALKDDNLEGLQILDLPLATYWLSEMRRVDCNIEKFRGYMRKIGFLLGAEASAFFNETSVEVDTGLGTARVQVPEDPHPVIIPILRAGLGLADGVIDAYPGTPVGHIGVVRDHETFKSSLYLERLPPLDDKPVLLVDPMLATGNSLKLAIQRIKDHGVEEYNIYVICLVAAPEGVQTVLKDYPDITIVAAALDSHLNDQAYIVPGLGDAGDRLYGTY